MAHIDTVTTLNPPLTSEIEKKDGQTGLTIHTLFGEHNFDRWHRDLKTIAQCKGVWTIICPSDSNEAKLLKKPKRPDAPEAGKDPAEYYLNVSEYRLNLDAYEKEQDRLRTARALLLSTINVDIRDVVCQYAFPMDMVGAIKLYLGIKNR